MKRTAEEIVRALSLVQRGSEQAYDLAGEATKWAADNEPLQHVGGSMADDYLSDLHRRHANELASLKITIDRMEEEAREQRIVIYRLKSGLVPPFYRAGTDSCVKVDTLNCRNVTVKRAFIPLHMQQDDMLRRLMAELVVNKSVEIVHQENKHEDILDAYINVVKPC